MRKIENPSFALSFVSSYSNSWNDFKKNPAWKPWIETLDSKTRDYYQSIYHGNFYQQAFQTSLNGTSFLRKSIFSEKLPLAIKIEGHDLSVTNIETFLTKSGFTLFTLMITVSGNQGVDAIINLSLKLKNPDTYFEIGDKQLEIHEIISEYGNHIKTSKPPHIYLFQNHSYSKESDTAQLESDCFHLANFIPYSTESRFETTPYYYQRQIDDFGIRIYKNWFALSLNDSFVRISQPGSDPFKRWSQDYFTIYLYNLCLKNYLGYVNTQLVNVTGLSSKMERKKDEFIEFLNDTQYRHISSKFLPNDLFAIIGTSLGVPDEMQILEKKLQRISNYFKAKRDKAFNTALILITFLSLFTVIYDISMWFQNLGFMGTFLWPVGSLITGGVIILIIIAFFIARMRP